MKEPFADFSSRNKKVYIELPDFGFYHGPSEIKEHDRHIIGRDHLVRKLKAIITNSDSRTGAYLVTGYRGTGKSSLVNHVVAEVTAPNGLRLRIKQLVFRIIIVIFLGLLWQQVILYLGDKNKILDFLYESIFYTSILISAIALFMYRMKPEYGLNESMARLKELILMGKNKKTFYHFGSLYRLSEEENKKYKWIISAIGFVLMIFSISIKIVGVLLQIYIGNLTTLRSKKQAQQHLRLLQSIYIIFSAQFLVLLWTHFSTDHSTHHIVIKLLICLALLHVTGYIYPILSKFFRKFYLKNLNDFYNKIHRRLRWIKQIADKRTDNYPFYIQIFSGLLCYTRHLINKYLNRLHHDWVNKLFRFLYEFPKYLVQNTISPVFKFLSNYLNTLFTRSRIIPIHINLSYNNLEEKDILHLLVFYIRKHFKERRKRGPGWYLPGLLFTIIVILLIQDLTVIKESRKEIGSLYIIEEFLPSQSHYYMHHQDSLANKFDSLLEVSKYNYSQMYQSLFNKRLSYFKNKNNFTEIKYHFASIIFFSDLFVNKLWDAFKDFVFGFVNYQPNHPATWKDDIYNYLNLNYFPMVIFLLILFLRRAFRYKINFLGLNSNYYIEREMDLLYDSLHSSREEINEQRTGLEKYSFLSFFKRKKHFYRVAEAHDIEKGLLHILESMESIPSFQYHPEFLIIFDELDKVKSNEENGKQHIPLRPSSKQERENQQAIYRLLESFKYFMTTAPVKFIIIAGREMYDSYLADMTDRELNLRNIFNDVIYVNSFLTQPDDVYTPQNHDITYLTEQYVCQFLIPEAYLKGQTPDLKTYSDYLRKRYTEFQFPANYLKGQVDETVEKYRSTDLIQRQKTEKILVLLYQFIVYLLHMSNGTPKKIVSLFEQYIIKGEKRGNSKSQKMGLDMDKSLVAGVNPENFYLVFTAEKQFEIGLIASIMSPVFYSISSHLKNHNDKLLFSTTFILNHLFKFHTSAFSQGNLESSPELTEVYRNPEVRSYINRTIQYLCQTQLEEITGGFHQFKFPKQTALEIGYLSRISELSSAAFRFSLDESKMIKDFYYKKLDWLKNHVDNKDDTKTLTAHYYHLLGDVSFYEEDIDEAILCYQLTLSHIAFEKEKTNELSMTIYIRTLMHLGMCFEKIHSFEEAFSVYSRALLNIADFREISMTDLHAGLAQNKKSELFFYNTNKNKNYLKRLFPQFPKKKNLSGKLHKKTSQYQKLLTEHLTSDKLKMLHKTYFLEINRMFYQPIIARLQVQEKDSPDGLSDKDIQQAINEFEYLARPIDSKEKPMVIASFYKKLGNLLYYKNMYEKHQRAKEGAYYPLRYYLKSLYVHLTSFSIDEKDHVHLIEDVSNLNLAELKTAINDYFMLAGLQFIKKQHINFRPNILQSIAELLSSLGDICFYICTKHQQNNQLTIELLHLIHRFMDKSNGEHEELQLMISRKIKDSKTPMVALSVIGYYISASYFLRAKKYKQHSYQIQKIMYVAHNTHRYNNQPTNQGHNSSLSELLTETGEKEGLLHKLYQRAMRSCFEAYENVHNMQIEKYKEMLHTPSYLNDDIRDRISLKKLTIDVDTEPLTFIYERIRLATFNGTPEEFGKLYSKNLASPYLVENSMYNKAIKLRYKSYLNKKALEYLNITRAFEPFEKFNAEEIIGSFGKMTRDNNILFNKEKKENNLPDSVKLLKYMNKSNGSFYTTNDLFEHLITDTIYCLSEILEVYNTFGQDNIFNHSYIAKVHEDMVYWLILYRYYNFFMELAGMLVDMGHIENVQSREPWKRFVEPLFHIEQKIHGTNSSSIEKINKALTKELLDLQSDTGIMTHKGRDNNFKRRVKHMKSTITVLVRKDSQNSLDPIYHGEQAILHYYTALDLHREGRSYKQLIERLYHLNDDFNDTLFHFRLAQERYRINTNWINEHQTRLNHFLDYTFLYDQEAYTRTVLY